MGLVLARNKGQRFLLRCGGVEAWVRLDNVDSGLVWLHIAVPGSPVRKLRCALGERVLLRVGKVEASLELNRTNLTLGKAWFHLIAPEEVEFIREELLADWQGRGKATMKQQ